MQTQTTPGQGPAAATASVVYDLCQLTIGTARCHFKIKVDGKFVEQEPIIGRWYVHFEATTDPATGETITRDGNIGQYEGCGQFCDEDGGDISMVGDVASPWVDYLVQQL